jgi:hypothetical protein
MSTLARTTHRTHRTTPDRPSPQARLARRLAGPGWVIMTLACVCIAVIVSRYLTFDPEVYFAEQREAYLQHEFALGVHVLITACLPRPGSSTSPSRRPTPRLPGCAGCRTFCSPSGSPAT